ncbi:MAG: TldD/PmbA family protein, partial [candidate division FCPU426 bacterium]
MKETKGLGFGDLRDFLGGMVKELEKKVPYASAFAARKEGVRVVVSSAQMNITPEAPATGLDLTLWNGEQFFEYACNRLDATAIRAEALALADKAMKMRGKSPAIDIDPGEKLEKDFATPAKKALHAVPLKEKQAYAKGLQQALAGASPQVQNAMAVVGDLHTEEIFVNRAKNLRQQLSRLDEIMQVFVSDGKKTQQLWEGNSLAGGYELQGFCKGKAGALVADARRLLSAGRLEPGFYDIVADPHWSGIIAHEAFGHGTETDMYLKDRAKGKEYMGRQVASTITDLYDDPTLPGEAGSFFFDHEGQLARPNRILEKGILKSGMTDLYSASLLKYERSANGRRESWERKPYARMTNTFFAPGKSSPEELIAS